MLYICVNTTPKDGDECSDKHAQSYKEIQKKKSYEMMFTERLDFNSITHEW